MNTVRTRIAPSPNGSPHVGTAYQALFDWAFAKKHGGQFIVRIEDTDAKRKVAGAEEEVFEALNWLGLVPDESPPHGGEFGPYRQSERLALYQKYAQQLVQSGHAYKDGSAIRFKIPQSGKTVVCDPLRGEIEFENKDLSDPVLLKSDGFPTYHLAVVVDDHLMQITHPVRGEEWIPSYPKHQLIYKALGWPMPLYTHTPIIRGTRREKLGKRFGHSSLSWFRKEGFLPEALLNYLALLGWSHPEGREFFTLEEFAEKFDLKDLSSVGPVFDLQKLEWLNGEWIRFLPLEKLQNHVESYAKFTGRTLPGEALPKLLGLARERMVKLADFFTLCEFLDEEKFESNLAQNKDQIKLSQDQIEKVATNLSEIENWQAESIKKVLFESLGEAKKRDYFVSLYSLITGKPVGLPLFESMAILGQDKVLKRLAVS
ncbi:MAG: glutamate--tRNA ligase [bacterium]